jgi:hypothetical protein
MLPKRPCRDPIDSCIKTVDTFSFLGGTWWFATDGQYQATGKVSFRPKLLGRNDFNRVGQSLKKRDLGAADFI